MRTVDVLNSDVIGCRIFRPFNDKDLNTRLSCSMDFLSKATTRPAFLGDDGLRMQLIHQRCGIVFFVVNEVV